MTEPATFVNSPPVVFLSGMGCWIVALVLGAASKVSPWGKGKWHWRRFFWAYVGFSFALLAPMLVSRGLYEFLGRLIVLHGLPVLIAGKPPEKRSSSRVARCAEFLGGFVLLILVSITVTSLTTFGQSRDAARSSRATNLAPPVADSTSDVQTVTKPADRIGVGYHVRGGLFESAISGLRVESPPDFALEGRDEWRGAGLTGPEVVLYNADQSIHVLIENVPALQPEGPLRFLRNTAQLASEQTGATKAPGESWSLEVFGEARTFEAFVSPDRITRDAYFGFDGRAYRVTIEHATSAQGVKDKVAVLLSNIRTMPPTARAMLRQQLATTPDTQALVGHDASVRGRHFTSFRHGIGWTAPSGMWRFLSDDPLRMAGPNTVIGAVDDERGYRVLAGIVPVPDLGVRKALDHLTRDFEARSGPVIEGFMPNGIEFLSRQGSVSRHGVQGHVHVGVFENRGRIFYLILDGDPDTHDEGPATFRDVMAGWRSKVPTIATEHAAGVYVDHRLGYSFRDPPDWKVSATNTNSEGIVGTDVVWSSEGAGRITISSGFHPDSQGYGDALADVIYSAVRRAAESPGTKDLRESNETLGGLRTRHIAFKQGETQIDMLVLARSGVAFILRSEGRDAAPFELLRNNFELLP